MHSDFSLNLMILEKNNIIILGPMLDDAVSLTRGRADNLGQGTH